MSERVQLRAVLPDSEALARALEALRARGVTSFRAYSPASLLGLEHLLPRRGSPARYLVIAGALAGSVVGFWMPIGSSLIYRIITGGKPPAALLPYFVLGFELTVLFGGLTALIALTALADLRPGWPSPGYDRRFGEDKFGVDVECPRGEAPVFTALLQEAGAEEVQELRVEPARGG